MKISNCVFYREKQPTWQKNWKTLRSVGLRPSSLRFTQISKFHFWRENSNLPAIISRNIPIRTWPRWSKSLNTQSHNSNDQQNPLNRVHFPPNVSLILLQHQRSAQVDTQITDFSNRQKIAKKFFCISWWLTFFLGTLESNWMKKKNFCSLGAPSSPGGPSVCATLRPWKELKSSLPEANFNTFLRVAKQKIQTF